MMATISGLTIVLSWDSEIRSTGEMGDFKLTDHNLTGIVVGVTLSLSARIFPRSEAESNAMVRTGDTIVAF